MGGGLMQLVAYGAQDVFLTGKPEISFFKVVYRRHTNFAVESIQQTLNGTTGWGNRLTSTISRNGDLITNMCLEVTLPTGSSGGTSPYVNSIGHALIEYIELEIGGQRIDKHYGEYLEILHELTCPEEKLSGFSEMIGKRSSYHTDGATDGPALRNDKLYIPLQFFFCRNPGLALPLIALQYHEVKLNIKFRESAGVVRTGGTPGDLTDVKLFVDYVYLDSTERRRFAQMQHEYLIEQLQHTGPAKANDNTQRLNFNHPVKELLWVFRKDSSTNTEVLNFNHEGGGYYPFKAVNTGATTTALTPIQVSGAGDYYQPTEGDLTKSTEWFQTMKLQLNGHDRFTERDASYFRLVQPMQHHTRVPSKPVYLYSFALNPEAHQPSGSCNFSRLDNVSMKFTDLPSASRSNGDELLVYAVNYNVLRIMSGMGGLAYSN